MEWNGLEQGVFPVIYGFHTENLMHIFSLLLFIYLFLSSPKDIYIDFRKRGREGGRERERDHCERETLIVCLPYALRLRPKPTT